MIVFPLLITCWLVSVQAADWTIGIFVRGKGAKAEVSGDYLYPASIQAFVESYLEHHATARMAMIVDDETAAHLTPACTFSFATRCSLIPFTSALNAINAGSFVHRASVYVQRHFLNEGALKILQQAGAEAGFDSASYVLLTDVRDVVFEQDLFSRLRGRGDPLARGDHPLWFAQEHFEEGAIKKQLWNLMAMRQCFPEHVVQRIGDMPVSCSGTTVGDAYAVEAYVRAMQSYTLFCSGPGRKPPGGAGGMDQPAHMALLYDVILSRRGQPGWDAHYRPMFKYSLAPDSMSFPFHVNASTEPAYAGLRALTQDTLGGVQWGQEGQDRVVPIPTFSPDGEICTFGVIITKYVHAPNAAVRTEGIRFPGPACPTGTCPPCALVHQYDRHTQLVQYVMQRYTTYAALVPEGVQGAGS